MSLSTEPDVAATPPAPPRDDGPGMLDAVLTTMPSWLISLVVHMVILVMLAMSTIAIPISKTLEELTFGTVDEESLDATEFLDSAEFSVAEPLDESINTAAMSVATTSMELSEALPSFDATAEIGTIGTISSLPSFNPLDALNPTRSDSTLIGGGGMVAAMSGRRGSERARLVREEGGTEGSEAAVASALTWLINHQNRDGSWSFRPLGGVCGCSNPGDFADAYIGGTAMALLPFLGAGHTHFDGEYREQVNAGLYYLLSRQQTSGSLYEPLGKMYSHGLASIVLCEAYAMTRDPNLARPAQAALNFTAYAQDPVGGGWRYEVHQPGDTSVVGWQLMALKSGHMAQLKILPITLQRTQHFLNGVQSDEGAAYGYLGPGQNEASATTAIGLLCRMYLGWTRDEPALQRGIERIGKRGPSPVDMYYNYYATQVMRHYGGEPWQKWNSEMRDFLVKAQDKRGHAAGSWHMGESHSVQKGGRLYNTTMAAMILEVYYRYLPLYQSGAADDFEL